MASLRANPPLQYHIVQYCSDLEEITVTSNLLYGMPVKFKLPVTQDPMHVVQFVGAPLLDESLRLTTRIFVSVLRIAVIFNVFNGCFNLILAIL